MNLLRRKKASDVAALATNLEELKKNLAEKQQSLEDAEAQRHKDTSSFQSTNKELTEAIGALKGAITVLKKHQSFLQVDAKAPEVPTLTAALERYAFSHGEQITPSQRSAVQAFLQGPSFDSYSNQSGEIFGILSQMLEQFQEDQSNAESEEAKARDNFAALSASLRESIDQHTKRIQEKTAQKGEAEAAKQNAAVAIREAKEQQAAEENTLAGANQSCEEEGREYDARSKEQAAELQAIGQAVDFLNSDEAHALFGETFSFVQTKIQNRMRKAELTTRKDKLVSVVSKLRSVGVSGVGQLLLQAAEIPKGTFTVVITKIDSLVEDIKKEMANDVVERDTAIQQIHQYKSEIQELNNRKENLEAKLESLTADIEKLADDIAALNEENEKLDEAIKTAGANRSQENADFQKEQANLSGSVAVLKKTLTVLESFYNKQAFLQQPAGFQTYEKNAGGQKVLAMINKIISDAQQTQALGINDENSQQKAYEKLVKDMNLTVDANNDAIASKTEEKANKTVTKTEKEQELGSTNNDLKDKNTVLKSTEETSDFIRKNFDIRQAHQTQEIEALNQAKAFLQGMTE